MERRLAEAAAAASGELGQAEAEHAALSASRDSEAAARCLRRHGVYLGRVQAIFRLYLGCTLGCTSGCTLGRI